MRIETNLNVEKNKDALLAKSFVIQDQYIPTFAFSATVLKNDASFLSESADKSWMHVADKSNKACVTKVPPPTGTTTSLVACTDVNAHYYRNFVTDSATEDRQMALADADKTGLVVGFYAACTDPTFKASNCAVTFGKAVTGYSTVMPAFKKAQEAKAAAGGTGTVDNTVKTGATAMTTYAATLVAAIYALAF